MKKTSKIALAQALRVLLPNIKRKWFFEIMQQHQGFGVGNRYWYQFGQIPWEDRTDAERKAAKAKAMRLIRYAAKAGYVPRSEFVDLAKTDKVLTSILL